MKLSFTLTLADFKAAYRLHHSQKLGGRGGYTFLFIWLPIMAFLGLILFIVLSFYGDQELANGSSGFAIFSVLCLCSLYLLARRSFVIRRQVKANSRKFPPHQSDINKIVDIDDERIIVVIPESYESKFFWKVVVAFAQDDLMSLIYITRKHFILIPARVMSPDQRTELNDIIARHVTKRKL
jgi:hypothetical protein